MTAYRLSSTFTLLDLRHLLHKILLVYLGGGLGEGLFVRMLGFGGRRRLFYTGHAHAVGIRAFVDDAVEVTNDWVVQKRRQGPYACQATRLTGSNPR